MRRIAIVMFALLSGCSSMSEKERATRLENLMNGYTRTMEWSEFARAMHYRKLTPDRPPQDLTPYQNIKISDYRPGPATAGPDKDTVMRTVRLRYINQSRMTEHSLTTREVWQYSAQDERWYLISDLPVFPR